MGILTDGAQFKITGEEKIQTRGAGIMRKMAIDMQCNDFVHGDILDTDGARAVKGAMVTTGRGRCVVIKAGIGVVRGVPLSADEVDTVVGIGLERGTKIQNNCYKCKFE